MSSPIRVILQKSVENLGYGGDIVRVRPGFARNFLIPRGLAAPATAQNLARAEELKKQAAASVAAELADAQTLKGKLEGTSVKLERAVGPDNKMYGSVTSKDIEEAYAALGLSVDRRKIELGDAIKSLGLSDVKVRVHRDVVATLRVEVVKQG